MALLNASLMEQRIASTSLGNERKGKNTLGLLAAVSRFSEARDQCAHCGTGVVFRDGADHYSVLQGRSRLDELLDAKRRHLSETGEPLSLVNQILSR